jgi:hypothetical protein
MAMMSESGVIDDLARRGFTTSLLLTGDQLRIMGTLETLRPQDVVVREYHRFEGISDPDDMAIVYAIESQSGIRGTLVDAYGVYADPALTAFLGTVPIVEEDQ